MKNRLFTAFLLCSFLFTVMPHNASAQECAWAKHSSDVFDTYWPALATDESGNVYTLGIYESDTAHFGTSYVLNPASGTQSISLAKYDSSGHFLWVKTFGGSVLGSDRFSIATDHFGHIYIAGSFTTFSENFGSVTLPNPIGEGLFVVKLDEYGNVIWARNTEAAAGNYGAVSAQAIATDLSGNVFITGYYADSITFGSTMLPNSGTPGSNVLLVKYDSSGSVVWARNSTGSGTDGATCLTTDGSGNIYIAGWYSSSLFSLSGTTLAGSGRSNLFVAKFSPSGSIVWLRNTVTDTGYASVRSITTDATGDVFVSGGFNSRTLTLGSTVLTNANASVTTFDIFLAKYTSAGSVVFAKRMGDTGNEDAYSIQADASGNLYIGGWFDSPLSFGGPVLTNTGIFIAQFNTSGDPVSAKTAGNPGSGLATSLAFDGFGHLYAAGMFSVTLTLDGVTVTNTDSTEQMFVARFDHVSTGIESTSKPVHEYALYPNPAQNTLTISTDHTPVGKITITNLPGQELFSQMTSTVTTEVNISTLSPGLYFVTVTSADGSHSMVRKFIKE